MNERSWRVWPPPATIRFRLLAALAIALIPVLVLGAIQAGVVYSKDLENRRLNLLGASNSAAAVAKARIEASSELLATLTAQTVGLQCSQTLQGIVDSLAGYDNLIRFDRIGRVSCAAGAAPADPERRDSDWFAQLAAGDALVIQRAPPEFGEPGAILSAVRSEKDGAFDGAMAAIISLSSLRAQVDTPGLPEDSHVALVDADGEVVSQTGGGGYPADMGAALVRAKGGGAVFEGRDTNGQRRLFAVSSLVSGEFFVVLSAPAQELAAWSRLNMMATIVPPLLAFILAVGAVWVVTERVVLRWLQYLQRIASLYAKGRFSVRPVQAAQAPPEIAELAETLDLMAETIVARDDSLLESIAEKDRLMREIHHRVKNNLQVVSSLISMQQRALSDPVARAAMQDTRQRVSALSLVYRALYQGTDLRAVDLKPFLDELTAQLLVSETSRGHVVDTELSVDHLEIDPDRLAPLALFAVEAITNAQKHAFAGKGGALRITFHVRNDVGLLEIADSGAGAREAVAGRLGEGMGRTLMTAFARQLGGSANFYDNDEGGLTAALSFPTRQARLRNLDDG